jgi:hypothetical protein
VRLSQKNFDSVIEKRLKEISTKEAVMSKNIPSAMSEVEDHWLAEKIVAHPDFANTPIKSIERETIGEGIGQVGEFNQVIVETGIWRQNQIIFEVTGAHRGHACGGLTLQNVRKRSALLQRTGRHK